MRKRQTSQYRGSGFQVSGCVRVQPVRARTYRHARAVVVVGMAILISSMRGGGAPKKVTAGKRRRILLPAIVIVGVVGVVGVREGGEAANCPDDVASAFVHDVVYTHSLSRVSYYSQSAYSPPSGAFLAGKKSLRTRISTTTTSQPLFN
jgi:hypothetical protein